MFKIESPQYPLPQGILSGVGDTDIWGTLQIWIRFVRQRGIQRHYPWNKQTNKIESTILFLETLYRLIIGTLGSLYGLSLC